MIQGVLIAVCVLSLLVVLALRLLRRGSTGFAAVAGVTAVAVVAWGLTGQVYAAEGERRHSVQVDGNLPQPYDWVEEATGGESVVVLGQEITDATGIWLTEFFNPSVRKMWSLDGSAQKVGGPILTPDLDAVDGTLTPIPETKYVLAVNGVTLQAPVVAQRENAVLYRIDGGPVKLQDALVGRQSDGWMVGTRDEPDVARASYTRYDVSEDEPGLAVVGADPASTGAPIRVLEPREGDGADRARRDRRGQSATDRERDRDSALPRAGLRSAGER